jgi:hypothetical protein
VIAFKLAVVEHANCISTIACISEGAFNGCRNTLVKFGGDIVDRSVTNVDYVVDVFDFSIKVVTILL